MGEALERKHKILWIRQGDTRIYQPGGYQKQAILLLVGPQKYGYREREA